VTVPVRFQRKVPKNDPSTTILYIYHGGGGGGSERPTNEEASAPFLYILHYFSSPRFSYYGWEQPNLKKADSSPIAF
jgi:hypothetical protein